jgi:crossover junction endodeoxyribonuclease RuvC
MVKLKEMYIRMLRGIFLIILGIDPGYAIVGYGLVEYTNNKFTPIKYGAILTSSGCNIEDRVHKIYIELNEIISQYKPSAMAVEKLFFTTNQRTVIDVAQARGVIMLCATINNVKFFEYTPLQVKQAVVGYGRAEKSQVMEMTKRILCLKEVPKPDDTADALAIAICHGHTRTSVCIPERQKNHYEKKTWESKIKNMNLKIKK